MDFARYVESFATLYWTALGIPVGDLPALSTCVSFRPERILILAPHPDDECLMSGFAVRAAETFQTKVAVIPFSYGSKIERRTERKVELARALSALEFELVETRGVPGSSGVLTRDELHSALKKFQPDVVISTHPDDGHPVHMHSAELAKQVLQDYANASKQSIRWLQSEFWQSMQKPNLLIPLSSKHLAKMGSALLAHVGEISRNPYHLTLPAWAMEQVRRGSEMQVDESGMRVSGSAKAKFVFGQLYRMEMIAPK
jgi:LmbE family N-acetylglucosaminyl deacetylase